jgi:hypothetical protein
MGLLLEFYWDWPSVARAAGSIFLHAPPTPIGALLVVAMTAGYLAAAQLL